MSESSDNTDKYVGFGCMALILLGCGIGALSCGIDSCKQAQRERKAAQTLAEYERKLEQRHAAIEAAKSPEQREAERKVREARAAEAKQKREEEQRQKENAAAEERKQRTAIRNFLITSLKECHDLAYGPDFVLISYPIVMAETHISENRILRIPGEMKQASYLAKKRLALVKQIHKNAEKLPNNPDIQLYIKSLDDLEDYFNLIPKGANAWLAFVNTADRDVLDDARRYSNDITSRWNEFESAQRELKESYRIRN